MPPHETGGVATKPAGQVQVKVLPALVQVEPTGCGCRLQTGGEMAQWSGAGVGGGARLLLVEILLLLSAGLLVGALVGALVGGGGVGAGVAFSATSSSA